MLKDFYKDNNIPGNKQIPLEKDILLLIPSENFDIKPILERLGISKYEVAVTYPKEGIDMFSEVCAIEAKLFIQIGEEFFDEYLFMPDDGSQDEDLRNKVSQIVNSKFIGLHHHDEFSIKDGLGTVDKLIKLLKSQRQSFCCITNHGGVGGWIKQYNACKKNKIKAIFGCEVYTSDYRGDDIEERKKHRSANHLILIAKTMEGFENIIKIHNDAQTNGFYYTPRANYEAFQKWGKGIIGSTACMKGEMAQMLLAGDKKRALEVYNFYAGTFDEFYIEIQIIECELQREVNRKLIEFAKEVGAPLLLTCDSHYLEAEHTETHSILMCIRQHKTLFDVKGEENEDVWNFDVKNLYYRNAEQMREVFEKGFVDDNGILRAPFKDDIFTEEVFIEAMLNTRKIAISTDDIKLDSTVKLPRLYENGKSILRIKVNEGFTARELGKKSNANEYLERVRKEFEIITRLGWTDYFLIIEMIVTEAKKNHGEWAVGYGRGCFHPSMRVVTGSGIPKFIGQIRRGDVVVSHDGTKQNVLDVFEYNVDEELIELETSDGRIIRCTLDHKIWVNTRDGRVWKEAKDILEGDDIVEV
jgi:DNA polymerase III alpha subunit (gram-positive type)